LFCGFFWKIAGLYVHSNSASTRRITWFLIGEPITQSDVTHDRHLEKLGFLTRILNIANRKKYIDKDFDIWTNKICKTHETKSLEI